MGKKRQLDHQQDSSNNLHTHHQGGGITKQSTESKLLHKLNTHFKKLSKMSPAAGNATATVTAATIHACNGGSPGDSSSTTSTRFLDINDDPSFSGSAVFALKFSENETSSTVTTSFIVATEIQELFGAGDFTFDPDMNAAHGLLHVEFGFGVFNDPITFLDFDFAAAKYNSDMLKLSSPEEMIQEFLKNNLFD